jgi:prolyl oligopeptidase
VQAKRSLPLLLLTVACGSPSPATRVTAPTPAPAPSAAPLPAAPTAAPAAAEPPYLAHRGTDSDLIHGVRVPDPYRWLEAGDAPEVRAWDELQAARYIAGVDALPQRPILASRLDRLLRYDDTSYEYPCKRGNGMRFTTRRADQDKSVFHLRARAGAPDKVVLDPNTWAPTETVGAAKYSDDCRYLAYGVARAGDENAVLHVLDVRDGRLLPDTFAGWRQEEIVWLPDSSGFYYSARPLRGEVPAGDEHYFHRVYFHRLGSTAAQDPIVFENKQVKENYHGVAVSEDGRWLLLTRSTFYEQELFLQDLRPVRGELPPQVPIVTGFGHEYNAEIIGDRLIVMTNEGAPRRKVMTASLTQPQRAHWKELIPEGPDRITGVSGIAGHLYVSYLHDASTRIAVHALGGKKIRDITLPYLGSGGVSGYWSRPEVYLSYGGFADPGRAYRYDLRRDKLTEIWKSPIDFDVSKIVTEQVWYTSKDGTRIPMFLVHGKDVPLDGNVPYLLTGYGGFDISQTPYFSTSIGLWIEAGGGLAVPSLRGGGEYGQAWHEAGMGARKQNVFDDFLGAAEWLVAEKRTSPARLAISGGSNGGLLVAAAVVQRPDLFRAVLCSVPLTDMIRYQKFGLANIWAEEYGSSDVAADFPALMAYSPYHRVQAGVDYPAVLVVGSENDARTNAMHARKFAAALQWADPDHGSAQPIYLDVQRDSGHGGGVTIATVVEQGSRKYAFLMSQVGLMPAAN